MIGIFFRQFLATTQHFHDFTEKRKIQSSLVCVKMFSVGNFNP